MAIPELRRMAKKTGKDHKLALKLWKTGIPEAMILAGMVDHPEEVTEQQMEDWVKAVNWALRNIGKRNPNLNKVAIKAAKEIQKMD